MSNKTSDKNVGSIEEDIKILENLKSYLNLLVYEGKDKIIYNDLLWDEKTVDCINAIEHLINNYTRQKQINEEHKKVNGELRQAINTVEKEKGEWIEECQQKDKRIQELEEELAKYKDIDYMFKIDSNENRVDMKKIYFEWLEYKNKIQKLEEESEILEFQNKQVENYAEELKKYNKTVSDRIVEYKKNSIPKQVVIDKIKEYDKKMEEDAGHPNWVVTDRIVMNVLQELLEGEGK